ncbi:hypothetical protein L1887_46950 [Cichorium endivia]|nr:hypothetical protein L1887_46950 [Cichorium endivia]
MASRTSGRCSHCWAPACSSRAFSVSPRTASSRPARHGSPAIADAPAAALAPAGPSVPRHRPSAFPGWPAARRCWPAGWQPPPAAGYQRRNPPGPAGDEQRASPLIHHRLRPPAPHHGARRPGGCSHAGRRRTPAAGDPTARSCGAGTAGSRRRSPRSPSPSAGTRPCCHSRQKRGWRSTARPGRRAGRPGGAGAQLKL